MESVPVAWWKPEQQGSPPSARSGHSLTEADNALYCFGGLRVKRPPGPNNELYRAKLSGESMVWEQLRTGQEAGAGPCARWGHTMTPVSGGTQLLLFGGLKNATERLNDAWLYDIASNSWRQPESVQATLTADTKRFAVREMDDGVGARSGPGAARQSYFEAFKVDANMEFNGQDTNPLAPAPRAGHSATRLGSKVVVFGGYGGAAFQRKDFNDVRVFDTDIHAWVEAPASDSPAPLARANHSAAALDDHTLLVQGGWSATHKFHDSWVYDLRTGAWAKLATPGRAKAKWGAAYLHHASVPHWQAFIFGGNKAAPTLADESAPDVEADLSEAEMDDGMEHMARVQQNDMWVMDGQHRQWVQLQTEGELPLPRADAAMAYLPGTFQIVLFGGWAARWLGDVHVLNVQQVVGPAYAIMAAQPAMVPNTGNVQVTLDVRGVHQGDMVLIRLVAGDKAVDCQGSATAEGVVSALLPSLESLKSRECHIHISKPGDIMSITSVAMRIFNVSHAPSCLAFGPGLLAQGLVAGQATEFIIQAVDEAGQNRDTGRDEFLVQIQSHADIAAAEAAAAERAKAAKLAASKPGKRKDKQDAEAAGAEEEPAIPRVPAAVKDLGDGQYLVQYTAPEPGRYSIGVEFLGTHGGKAGPVRGSVFEVELSAEGDAVANTWAGSAYMESLKNDIKQLNTFARQTLDGLLREVPADSLDTLLAVKTHLSHVSEHEFQERLRIDRVAAGLQRLREHAGLKQRDAEKLEKALEIGASTWEQAQRQAPQTKTTIAPHIKHHSASTKREVELFQHSMREFDGATRKLPAWLYETGLEGAGQAIKDMESAFSLQKKRVDRIQHLATTFDFPHLMQPAHAIMTDLEEDIQLLKLLWQDERTCADYFQGSREQLWAEVNPDGLEEGAKQLHKDMKKHGNKRVRGTDLYKGLDKAIKDFLSTCPIISALGHKSMRPRHWGLLMQATGKTFTPPHEDEHMRLQNLLDLALHDHTDAVDEICDQALKEEKMEDTLARLREAWAAVQFETEPFDEAYSDVTLVKMTEEDFEMLENDQLAVQSMVTSRFVQTFYDQIMHWRDSLSNVSEVMLLLAEIQRTWSYLEPLFIRSDEVRKELPADAQRFEEVDAEVKEILAAAVATSNVKQACNREGLLGRLERGKTLLDACQKALDDFLAAKRVVFPRFYFVSNADLLDILSNGSSPARIMKHVTKVYLATDTLELTDVPAGQRPRAKRWVSCVGTEDVHFAEQPALEGKPEQYLQVVLEAQQTTMRQLMEASLKRFPSQGRIEWLMQRRADGAAADPSQLGLLIAGMKYVQDVERGFKELQQGNQDGLKQTLDKVVEQLTDLIRLTRTDLSKADRRRVMNLITMDAHSRSVVELLLREHVTDPASFQWQCQLKQVYEDGEARIRVADARFPYMYEYLGNGARLVITPLTDRIYVTATQALNLCMGCAPAGPAGTGKTETTKDLGAAISIPVYVVNCAPEMDYRTLGNIFKGLAASGSWGCFDEFNRLVPSVLSVCSVQFKAVCDGIKQKRRDVTIEGETVRLIWSAGAFITMNPGYLGRSELPEGLKALFRPITVMVPDLVLICENMLMAEGFEEAKELASKFYGLYSLLRELLSKQSHYDWGLRAVKSVLVVAGGFKRAEPDVPEHSILMRALRDFNTPKIVKADEPIFFGLLGDLFPGIDPPRKINEDLETAITQASLEAGLDPDPLFRLKSVQLEELLEIRHCVFVMGPPAAGKTECWKTLVRGRARLGVKTKFVDLNPKAVTPSELYGYVHPATREWKDGLLSKIMRDLGTEPNRNPKWIVLDGDLDANWIESMNSVMDDNKMLTLASNERIPLKDHMRMIFEIRDLRFASPATVSRAGIIYISTNTGSQWRSLIKSWLHRQEHLDPAEGLPPLSPGVAACLRRCFDKYCERTITWFLKFAQPLVPITAMTKVGNMLRLLDVLLTPELRARFAEGEGDEQALLIETYFVFCAVWAFGSTLSEKDGEDYRHKFSEFWRDAFRDVRMPSRETLFDYHLDSQELKFDKWEDSPYFSSVDFDSQRDSMMSLTVPTPETCSITYWMNMLVAARLPVMLVGSAGCGKTQLVQGLLGQLDPEQVVFEAINFNFFTDAEALQAALEAPLEKKTGTNYGPPGQARLVYFVDDLNLPELDPYDTQSAVALMRQQLDYQHLYDRQKLTLKNIRDTQYVAAMNPTAGSFLVNPRLQRHFFTFAVGFPGPSSLYTIYNTVLAGHLQHFVPEVQDQSSSLLNAALQLHAGVASSFRKSAANFHYEFNIRHLSNVFQGMLMAAPDDFKSPTKMVSLWLHESERVYGDRLVCAADVERYTQLAQGQAKKKFSAFNNVLQQYFVPTNPAPLIFAHFAEGITEKAYNQITAMPRLSELLEEALREYNESNATMNLVLFEDAMRHVCRITRIINNPSGHALLVGVGGSGKQSLSRLAAFICGFRVKQIVISGSYSMNDFREDLKSMYRLAGVKEEGVAFLFTDSQVFNERALVFMNDLLASGNIPGLFPPEELDDVVAALTARVKAAGISPERKNVLEYFLNEVRKNLHVILCFSPVGDDFRTRAKRFPALVNCTVIDWFQPWPEQALFSVGKHFLTTVPDLGSKAVVEGIAAFLPHSFKQVNSAATRFFASDRRYVYTTPKSYLELLKLYEGLLMSKRNSMDAAIARLTNGLAKLRETAEAVEQIEADLKVKLAEAEVQQSKAAAIAEEVSKNKEIVETETNNASAIKAEAEEIAARASSTQAEADTALAAAEPAVRQAEEALATLNEKDLTNCRTMQRPPPGVGEVFYACMCLLATVDPTIPVGKRGNVRDKDRTWDAVKKLLLSNVKGFMGTLLGFKAEIEADKVPDINFEEVRPYIALEYFNREGLLMKNSAAAGLCEWVINIVMFRDIYVTVAPLREALANANAEYEAAQSKLSGAVAQVEKLSAELAVLEQSFAEAAATKKAAEDQVARGELRLSLANRLTSALADENVRWAQSVQDMRAEKELLVGDVLLAAAFISYIGPFTKAYRDELIRESWVPFLEKAAAGSRIPMSASPDPLAILTSDAEKAAWNSQGLPDDQVSTENAVIVTNTARWPLLIDPQLQGVAWVRGLEASHELIVTRLSNKDMLRKLEFAVEQGKPVLIENIGEKVDAVLNPVIQRSTIKRGTRRYLKLGEKELEFNPDFRLYLHTKLSNPHYPPEVQAETALVNFTVTQAGLEDQLLAMTVQKEREDLARIKTTLIQQQNEFKIKMKQLEDAVLQKLADAEGDITEDVELIESLENTKRIAHDIQEKSVVAQTTEATINTIAEKYRSVARRGALLFFIMNSLFKVHTYYIYSLASFVTIFLRAIDLVSGGNNPMKAELDAVLAEQAMLDRMQAQAEEEAQARAQAQRRGGKEADSDSSDSDSSDSGSSDGSDSEAGEPDQLAEGKSSASKGSSEQAASLAIREGLNDEQLARRCDILMQSINATVFQYVKRGMFERDKLMFATKLALSILVDTRALDQELVTALILGTPATEPGTAGPLSDWIPEAAWARAKGLETVKPEFERLGDDMQAESERWQKWFNHETPESLKPPAQYKNVSEFHKLLLLRAMRPDRIPEALTGMVSTTLGAEYVLQKPFDMLQAFEESAPSVPIFFVLFPGVDPTEWVEGLGEKLGITADAGKFVNISMGQGQDGRAMAVLDQFSQEGGWIMLQNVHLMQEWLPLLERKLEAVSGNAHEHFRCFISAEPPPLSYLKNMPESLMQGAIKIANEAPADLKSNLVRAWANFSQDEIDASKKPAAYKACLFTLCFYHAVVLGRRRFGQAGWSRVYSFNVGDLRVSADVLMDYINHNAHIPWEDLRYLTGEIFYGGHITSFWDRRTNNTYLQVFLQPGILQRAELAPGFQVPNVVDMSFEDLNDFMLNELPHETPPMFGMHPNAEIGYLTSYGASIFEAVLSLQGGSASSGGDAASGDGVANTISTLLGRLPENFFMIELEERAQPLLAEQSAPYVLVAIQECTRMNALLDEMRRTLVSLQKGLDGQLNMTDAMEDLSQALSINQVPGRNPFHAVSWENFAWPSRKSLSSWFSDLLARYAQLEAWVANMQTPLSVWLPGLFNPTALMTSIMQVVARRQGLPLDNMAVDTHFTTVTDPQAVTDYPASGLLCHGMYMEGGRWEMADESGQLLDPYDDGGVQCAGYLADSRLKELYPPLPLMYLKAVQVQPSWEPTSEGFVRHHDDLYEAPLYQTCFRGPTFVAICPVRTRGAKHKWVLRGTAITMQLDD